MWTVTIRGEQNKGLVLAVSGHLVPNPITDWDREWLACRAEAETGTFRGTVENSLQIQEFQRFKEQLRSLYGDLSGTAALETLERWIRVVMKGDGLGHIATHVEVVDGLVEGSSLEYWINLDQTYLPPLIRELEEICGAFPVVAQ